jgi:catalase
LEGVADHWNHRADADYCSPPGNLFRLMSAARQKMLFENMARSIGGAPPRHPVERYPQLPQGSPGLR